MWCWILYGTSRMSNQPSHILSKYQWKRPVIWRGLMCACCHANTQRITYFILCCSNDGVIPLIHFTNCLSIETGQSVYVLNPLYSLTRTWKCICMLACERFHFVTMIIWIKSKNVQIWTGFGSSQSQIEACSLFEPLMSLQAYYTI